MCVRGLVLRKKKVPQEGKKIEKPEDKVWREWYNKLSQKDHEEMLAKLGIDKKEKQELEKELKKEKVLA
jgi:hypothetical protein